MSCNLRCYKKRILKKLTLGVDLNQMLSGISWSLLPTEIQAICWEGRKLNTGIFVKENLFTKGENKTCLILTCG